MKVRVPVRGARALLMAVGLGLLGYCGYVIADAWWFQKGAQEAFAEELAVVETSAAVAAGAVPVLAENVWGRVSVARLGMSVMVLEGTSAKTLRRAAGHISGTAAPGEGGNVGISGHRDTFFYPLRNIRATDEVTVTTRAGAFRYRVVAVSVVKPEDSDVLVGGDTEVLTLVTCYPFAFIGPAPERYVVRAERME